MPIVIKEVKAGDRISAGHTNQLVRSVNKLQRIRSDGTIRVIEDSSGILLSACLPPQPFWFQLTQDTPTDQGYVTVRKLRWNQTDGKYETVSAEPESKVYDRLLSLTYGGTPDNDNRCSSQWTKTGFVGRAEWAADKGQWQISQIEHVARFINFHLTAALASGNTTVACAVDNYWDGLDPLANGGSITLHTDPTNNYAADNGAKGCAVWRNDGDNSTKWQYQIIDIAAKC